MTKEVAIEVRSNTFANLTTTANGGVINLVTNVKLIVAACTFVGNKATGSSSYGGSIYISSTKDYLISKTCVYECVGSEGHFLNSVSSSSPVAMINETMTTLCNGTRRGVIMITSHNLIARVYNSSSCTSSWHCNVHSFLSSYTSAKYMQFFKNNEDIVYGTDSSGSNHNASCINLISNGKSQNTYGYLYIHKSGGTITYDDIYAYDNLRSIIFYANSGTIVVKSFKGNACGVGGGGSFSGSITSDSQFVCTTKMIDKLYCLYSQRETRCSIRRCTKTLINYVNAIIILVIQN